MLMWLLALPICDTETNRITRIKRYFNMLEHARQPSDAMYAAMSTGTHALLLDHLDTNNNPA